MQDVLAYKLGSPPCCFWHDTLACSSDRCAGRLHAAARFDFPRFYKEVRRVLKIGGCFATWMYGLPTLCHKGHPANEVMWHLYDTVLGGHWAAGRKHVEAEYVGIEPVVGQDFNSVQRLSFETTRTARVNDVVRGACPR